MVTLYNASSHTRRLRYYEAYKKQQMSNGILITKRDELLFKDFGLYLDYHLRIWLQKEFSEAFILSKIFKKLCKSHNFKPAVIKSTHMHWYFEPNTVDGY